MTLDLDAIATERADWLVDAIAGATQNRQFLRGDPEADHVAIEAILLNGHKAIMAALRQVGINAVLGDTP